MTNELPKFEKGQRLKASDLQALAHAVAAILRHGPGFGTAVPLMRYCKLDGDLAAATATDSETASAPTATVSIYVPTITGTLEDSGQNETVVNRFGIEYLAGTLGLIVWADEYIFMGDCAPLS